MLHRCSIGIQLGGYKLAYLDYADDIAIFAPSACVLQEALTILQEEANIVVMQISWPKTKLMAVTTIPTNHPSLTTQRGCTVCGLHLLSRVRNHHDVPSSRDITYHTAKAASTRSPLSTSTLRQQTPYQHI